jgi:hypothetical protein
VLAKDEAPVDGKLRTLIKQEAVNLAQLMAEYRQTCSMFVSLATDIVITFRSIRSGRGFSDFVTLLQLPRGEKQKRLADRWLQYQYGLKPLISDLYESTNWVADKLRAGFPRKARASHRNELRASSNGGSSHSGAILRNFEERVCTKSVQYWIREEGLAQLSQVGITNPALLAWELIPYSFVVDQMIPVGNFLASLDALVAIKDLKVVNVDWWRQECTSQVYGQKAGFYFHEEFNRTVQSTLGLPRLTYKPSESLTAVLNGLALLTQLRHR